MKEMKPRSRRNTEIPPMSESFIRNGNKDLEAKIRTCNSAWDLQNMLAEADAVQVIQGGAPEPVTPSTVGTGLKEIVQTEDGRRFLLQADSFYGLDILRHGLMEDLKFHRI